AAGERLNERQVHLDQVFPCVGIAVTGIGAKQTGGPRAPSALMALYRRNLPSNPWVVSPFSTRYHPVFSRKMGGRRAKPMGTRICDGKSSTALVHRARRHRCGTTCIARACVWNRGALARRRAGEPAPGRELARA